MNHFNFEQAEETIDKKDWFRFNFGSPVFNCPGLTDDNLDYYLENEKLPSPCNSCFKGLIFWNDVYSKETFQGVLRTVESLGISVIGKLNRDVVVFYFDDKGKMLKFLTDLSLKLEENQVKGKVQWRRACREYQDANPKLWKNAKEFIPDLEVD